MIFFTGLLALPLISAASIPASVNRLAKRADICGAVGYDLGTAAYYFGNATLVTKEACGAHCLGDVACASFAIGNNACLNYALSVTNNFRADTNSPYTFYDKSCAVETTSTTSTSTVASTTTSTASTSSVSSSSIVSSSSSAATSSTSGSSVSSSTFTSSSSTFGTSTIYSTTSVSPSTTPSASSPPPTTAATTTTSSPSTSSTSTTTSTSPMPVSSCGLRGYDRNNPVAFDDRHSRRYHTLAGCSNFCKSTSECLSFALGDGECYIYSTVVAGNFEADFESPYLFYDSSCIESTTVESDYSNWD